MLTEYQRLRNLEVPTEPADLVIDSDTYNEIDDQFAIAYALACPEKLHVQALFAAPFFNERSSGPADGMERSYQEMLKLLSLAGKDLPVFRGSDRYLPDEQTAVSSPAVQHLLRLACGYSPEHPLYVVAIGAITNIASALILDPSLADRLVVVWLGGHALEWPQNAEFNCRQDVAAARVVFASGVPLVMLPCMGVVSAFTTTGPELSWWLQGKNRLCDYLVSNTVQAAERYAAGRVWSRVLWDVTAVAWLMNQDECFMCHRLIPTPIPEYDHHYAFDSTRPFCRYVWQIRRDPLMQDLFTKLTGSGPAIC